jgi:hypothetical protein
VIGEKNSYEIFLTQNHILSKLRLLGEMSGFLRFSGQSSEHVCDNNAECQGSSQTGGASNLKRSLMTVGRILAAKPVEIHRVT